MNQQNTECSGSTAGAADPPMRFFIRLVFPGIPYKSKMIDMWSNFGSRVLAQGFMYNIYACVHMCACVHAWICMICWICWILMDFDGKTAYL